MKKPLPPPLPPSKGSVQPGIAIGTHLLHLGGCMVQICIDLGGRPASWSQPKHSHNVYWTVSLLIIGATCNFNLHEKKTLFFSRKKNNYDTLGRTINTDHRFLCLAAFLGTDYLSTLAENPHRAREKNGFAGKNNVNRNQQPKCH